MSSTNQKWYYELNCERFGPYSKAEIGDRKRSGLIPMDVRIYERKVKKSGGSWTKRQIKLLKMNKRDFLVVLMALIVTALIVGFILFITNN